MFSTFLVSKYLKSKTLIDRQSVNISLISVTSLVLKYSQLLMLVSFPISRNKSRVDVGLAWANDGSKTTRSTERCELLYEFVAQSLKLFFVVQGIGAGGLSSNQFPAHSAITRFKRRCAPHIKQIFSDLVCLLVERGEMGNFFRRLKALGITPTELREKY